VTVQQATYESAPGQLDKAYVFRMTVHASMRSIDHTVMLAVRKPADGGPAVLLLAPDSVCSCEQGLECSHMYCLLLVLYCMQDCSSWDDFSSKVLFYDKARAPSGKAVWWVDRYPHAPSKRTSLDRLSMDAKVTAPLAAAPAAASDAASHVSGADQNYQRSDFHLGILRELCATFRGGSLALLLRAEYGDLFAPPPPGGLPPTPPGSDDEADGEESGGGLDALAAAAAAQAQAEADEAAEESAAAEAEAAAEVEAEASPAPAAAGPSGVSSPARPVPRPPRSYESPQRLGTPSNASPTPRSIDTLNRSQGKSKQRRKSRGGRERGGRGGRGRRGPVAQLDMTNE